jgi:hypothetical protein
MGQLVDIQPPKGFDLDSDVCTLTAHAALVLGDVVCLDVTAVDTNSGLFYLTAAYPAGSTAGVNYVPKIFLVCIDATVASGANGRFALRGNVKAKCLTTSVAIGDYLCPTTAGSATSLSESTTPIVASSVKIIAIARQTNATANAVIDVMFDGYQGVAHGGVPN